jgi:dihydroneopterin aldolase / 2-amino-4-hydroxy-6-hydroxymethyldihydropteridine diphosphokinase
MAHCEASVARESPRPWLKLSIDAERSAEREIAMIDRIELRGLRLMTIVGVLDHERQAAQPLELDITMHLDLSEACRTDDLDDTVHYGDVCETIEKVAAQQHDLLLERFAGRVAEAVLEQPRVEAVDVSVRKLRPPVPSALETSGVTIHRTRAGSVALDAGHHRAILALGSNLGDRAGYLRFATRHLGHLVAESEVYETAPVGGPDDQGSYLNMVIAIDTPLDPFALLRRCQRVEAGAGRERKVHWGPRTLDVDVLFYDDVTMSSPGLAIPHPRINERGFVLAPLHDVAPDRVPANWAALAADGGVTAIGRLDVV